MKALLSKAGVDVKYQVDYCITGQESLDQVKEAYEYGFNYKYIFTDFSMPIMDGIESTRLIRKHMAEVVNVPRSEQPVIIGVTGHIMAEFQKKGLEAGMDKVMGKPMYFSTLQSLL